MLHFTGHPLVDVGVATVTAFSEKERPEDVTEQDLDSMAEFIVNNYVSELMMPYLSSTFTKNAVYIQNVWTPAQRREKSIELLSCRKAAQDPQVAGLPCFISGEPATRIAYRQHVPMLTGMNTLNFFPAGLGGLPISGKYLFCLQALPLGCRRCVGKLLAVHSPDDAELTIGFAREFLKDNRRILLMGRVSEEDKYLDAKVPKTMILRTFLEIEDERQFSKINEITPCVSVYHLTNDGRDPQIDIFHLPSEVVSFLRFARSEAARSSWQKIESRAWQLLDVAAPKKKKKGSEAVAEEVKPLAPEKQPKETARNFLYEDLFSLPQNAKKFLRTYFLRRAIRHAGNLDPRSEYRIVQDLDLISWELTSRFLQEIMGMEQSRINAIREFADKLATYVATENDRSFFQRFNRLGRYGELRVLLIKASNSRVKRGLAPIVDFDEFVEIFESVDGPERSDWNLARDLIMIRLIQQLHKQSWFGGKEDLLEPEEEPAEAQ